MPKDLLTLFAASFPFLGYILETSFWVDFTPGLQGVQAQPCLRGELGALTGATELLRFSAKVRR